MCSQETIVALSTPLGHSGIGLIRVSGPNCGHLIPSIFGKAAWVSRQAILSDYRDLCGVDLDRVLFTFFAGPASYTGEDMIEISCHGNPLILRQILDDLCRRGCRLARAGEFTRRAFLNGKMDLSQAEAINDFIHAQNALALRLAKNSMEGEVGRQLEPIFESLLKIFSPIAAQIDFPEEDLPAIDRCQQLLRLADIRDRLEKLRGSENLRSIAERGIGIVLVGPPNVGKSSILNGLLGRDRAIVSAEAGTTRDFIEEVLFIDSLSVRLCDTAGLRRSDDPIEISGMKKTAEKIAAAQIVCWVLDRSMPSIESDSLILEESQINILILNKSDLPRQIAVPKKLAHLPTCEICARNPQDLDRLRTFLLETIRRHSILPDDCSFVLNLRQSELLGRAEKEIESVMAKIEANFPPDLVAEDLHAALDCLSQINGRDVSENLLDRIFSSFCIGK